MDRFKHLSPVLHIAYFSAIFSAYSFRRLAKAELITADFATGQRIDAIF